METSPTFQAAVAQLLVLLGILLTGALAQLLPTIRIRVPRPRVPYAGRVLLRVVPAVGLVAAGALPSRAAGLQRKPRPSWAQTSSRVETDGPPPRPSVRPRRMAPARASHPAIHRATPLKGPLFPRARPLSETDDHRRLAMDPHPDGEEVFMQTYEVQLGDTLWGIAATVLKTDDPARIARFWPTLHKTNVDILGADPDRIYPGQILRIPEERA